MRPKIKAGGGAPREQSKRKRKLRIVQEESSPAPSSSTDTDTYTSSSTSGSSTAKSTKERSVKKPKPTDWPAKPTPPLASPESASRDLSALQQAPKVSFADFVSSIEIAANVGKEFEETRVAVSRYKESRDFLSRLQVTLQHLRRFAESNTESHYTDEINVQMERIEAPWTDFQEFLDKYAESLGDHSQRPRLGKAPTTVKWTLKDLSGAVDKLEVAIAKPLQIINTLLSLHSLETLWKLPEQLLSADQCSQILEAIYLAQVPTELKARIEELDRTNVEHGGLQAEELRRLDHISHCLGQALSDIVENAREEGKGFRLILESRSAEFGDRLRRLYQELPESKTRTLIERQQTTMSSIQAAFEARIEILQANLEEMKKAASTGRQTSDVQSTIFTAVQWAAIILSLASGITAEEIVKRSSATYTALNKPSLSDERPCPAPATLSAASQSSFPSPHDGQNGTLASKWTLEPLETSPDNEPQMASNHGFSPVNDRRAVAIHKLPISRASNEPQSPVVGSQHPISRTRGLRQDASEPIPSPTRKRSKKKPATSPISTGRVSGNGKPAIQSGRPFPCPFAIYSCISTFSSKNEWKRHISTQHMRLGFWRCDLCGPSYGGTDPETPSYNDFNRKDLFTQHLRRMHAPPSNTDGSTGKGGTLSERDIVAHQQRCYQMLRSTPPASACLFCSQKFSGPGSWDERIEHVGRHMEEGRKGKGAVDMNPENWREDKELQAWLLREGLIIRERGGGWALGDGVP